MYFLELFHEILMNNFISMKNKKCLSHVRVYSHQLASEYYKRWGYLMKQRKCVTYLLLT